ncbi:MAG: hypothetical protein U0228_31575 [Myxococcaceae bacterium]
MRALSVVLALWAVTARAEPEVLVLVATVDLPAGAVVKPDFMGSKRVPASIATRSVVRADSASYLVEQRVNEPVLAGDLLRWDAFETTDRASVEACVKRVSSGDARKDVRQQRANVKAKAVARPPR